MADYLFSLIHGDASNGFYVGSESSNTLTQHTDQIEGKWYDLTVGQDNPVLIGYYLISSSLGSNLILATSDIDIAEKNTYPTVDKNIIGTSDKGTGNTEETFAPKKATDAQIGDAIKFQLKATIPDEANKGFTLHDTMDSTLLLKLGSTAFSVYTVDENGDKIADVTQEGNWSVHYNSTLTTAGSGSQTGVTSFTAASDKTDLVSGESFTVVFTKAYVDTLTADTTISEAGAFGTWHKHLNTEKGPGN